MPLFVDRSTSLIWITVLVVIAAAIAVIQFMRANEPERQRNLPGASLYTTGTVVDEVLAIPADQYLTFKLNFNKRMKVLGTHSTGDGRKRVLVMIISEADLEKWKAGEDVKPLSQTGYVPRGKIERVIEPGVYYLIYDNRSKEYGGDKEFEASFKAD